MPRTISGICFISQLHYSYAVGAHPEFKADSLSGAWENFQREDRASQGALAQDPGEAPLNTTEVFCIHSFVSKTVSKERPWWWNIYEPIHSYVLLDLPLQACRKERREPGRYTGDGSIVVLLIVRMSRMCEPRSQNIIETMRALVLEERIVVIVLSRLGWDNMLRTFHLVRLLGDHRFSTRQLRIQQLRTFVWKPLSTTARFPVNISECIMGY